MTTKVRIFLASPGDTEPARNAACAVVDGINADPAYRDRFRLELVRWDDPARPVPCSFLRNPQADVVGTAGDPGDCDLVVGLFRHHFGSPLTEPKWGLSPDGDFWTGTEWEIHRGLDAASRGQVKDVWVFRDTTSFQAESSLTTAEKDERYASYRRVCVFFDECRGERAAVLRGINEYQGPDDFPEKFGKRLREWLGKFDVRAPRGVTPVVAAKAESLNTDQQTLLRVLLESDDALDEALIQRVRSSSVTGIQGYLLSRYAYWAGREQGRLDRQFVNLDLLIDRGAGSDAERFERDARFDSLESLLVAHPTVGAWVLVGDPGCGKSAILQHHELTQARETLRASSREDERPELCVWQRLADYRSESPDPAEWLRERWQRTYPTLPPLDELERDFRIRYLLDGLNEIKAEAGEAHGQAVRRFADWAGSVAEAGHPAPLFSVRTLDYSEPLSSERLTVRQVRIAPWAPEQMRLYCTIRQGAGNTLWPAIDGDERLRSLCSLPFNLVAQCEVHAELGRPANGRAELLSALTWQRLRRGHLKHDFDGPGLLTGRDRKQLTLDGYWREHLLDLPGEGTLVPGLDRQAEAMHRASRGAEVSVKATEVGLWLTNPPDREAWLQAVQSLGLAEVELSGRFRYTHQLWQEFFAARGIREAPDRLPEGVEPPPLEPMHVTLGRLAVQDPLPGPGVSAWEEAIKLAVQLAPEPAKWIGALMAVNLPLAGRAALARKAQLPLELLGRLRWDLVTRSRDPATDLRLRIEAAEALGPLGDPRYREGRGPGGVRYLMPDDGYWANVAGGEYTIGSLDGEPDEQPLTKVSLQVFSIAWAPVTNAEFACFIEAGGYEDERWWEGETAGRWWRGELANEEMIAYWRERLGALRDDFGAAVERYFSWSTESYIEGTLLTYAAWSEAEAEQNLAHSFGARRHRLPSEWHNPRFNSPSQPVVGVSLFEAQAYCRWFSVQTGQSFRLPVEAEWEASARGTESRPWPWGESPPEDLRMNGDPAHLRRTSPVGVFPVADTPDAPCLTDLAGNVWEWTASEYTGELDRDRLLSALADGTAPRAVRGGSWLGVSDFCRAAFRLGYLPVFRDHTLGFRVVCCPIQDP